MCAKGGLKLSTKERQFIYGIAQLERKKAYV